MSSLYKDEREVNILMSLVGTIEGNIGIIACDIEVINLYKYAGESQYPSCSCMNRNPHVFPTFYMS